MASGSLYTIYNNVKRFNEFNIFIDVHINSMLCNGSMYWSSLSFIILLSLERPRMEKIKETKIKKKKKSGDHFVINMKKMLILDFLNTTWNSRMYHHHWPSPHSQWKAINQLYRVTKLTIVAYRSILLLSFFKRFNFFIIIYLL